MYQAALNGELLAFAELDKLNDHYEKLSELKAIFPKFKRINYLRSEYAAATPRSDDDLIAYINLGLDKISIAERVAIEKKWLTTPKSSTALNLGFSVNLPPYMGYSASGQPQGLYIDIWRLWSKYTDMPVNFVGDSMTRTLQQVMQGSLDVHIAYPDIVEDNEEVAKAFKMYAVHSQVFVSSNLPNVTSLAQLSGKTIGVFKTAPYIDEFKHRYPDIRLKYYDDHAAVIVAAERGEIVATISEVENMRVKLVNANLQSLFYLIEEPIFDIDMFTLVSSKNEELAQFIQEGFDQIPLGELKALESTWLSHRNDTYFRSVSRKLPLDNEQKQWLRENPVLKVGMASDWEPLEFVDASGKPTGINRDIIESVADSVGFEVEFQAFDNWSNLFNAFRREEVDLILGISTNEDRLEMFEFSDIYWDMPWSIIYRRSLGQLKQIKDLYGKQLAMVKGYRA